MFLGEYLHTFDAKNRVSLPAKFRKGLGRAVVITRGLDRCLYVFSRKEWEKEARRYAGQVSGNAASRGLARLFLAGSFEGEVDGAGRVLVPENLKAFAGIGTKAVVAGVADRVEIWDEGAWQEYSRAIERDADQFAEKVGAPAH
jgi:MraZ protein